MEKLEREQTITDEARRFAELLKSLEREKQEALYLIMKGAAVLAGEKGSIFK